MAKSEGKSDVREDTIWEAERQDRVDKAGESVDAIVGLATNIEGRDSKTKDTGEHMEDEGEIVGVNYVGECREIVYGDKDSNQSTSTLAQNKAGDSTDERDRERIADLA